MPHAESGSRGPLCHERMAVESIQIRLPQDRLLAATPANLQSVRISLPRPFSNLKFQISNLVPESRSFSPNSQILYPELHKLAPSERLVPCKLIPEYLMPFWRQPCAQSDFARYFGKPSALFFF